MSQINPPTWATETQGEGDGDACTTTHLLMASTVATSIPTEDIYRGKVRTHPGIEAQVTASVTDVTTADGGFTRSAPRISGIGRDGVSEIEFSIVEALNLAKGLIEVLDAVDPAATHALIADLAARFTA